MITNVKNYVDLLKRLAPEAKRLVLDSRTVGAGDVFIAVPGLHVDGRQFLEQAAQKAAAVVYEDDGIRRTYGVPSIAVPALSKCLGDFAAEFYSHPTQTLFGVGITGTNGKTTTSHWVSQLLTSLGEPCAAIGTIGCSMAGNPFPSAPLTTPDAATLQGLYRSILKAGAKAFAVEASSIGLEQGRLQGTHFDVAVFTNLSRDHLDYHADMRSYEEAKALLFAWPHLRASVINIDDEAGLRMAERCVCQGITCFVTTTRGTLPLVGTQALSAEKIRPMQDGMEFDLIFKGERHHLAVNLFGEFNISNLLGVIGVALAKGYSLTEILPLVPHLVPPAGRMQLVKHDQTALGVVDYSHTPDAVEKALLALRPIATARRGKLWVIVGAGGDRDSGKRPIMANIAQCFADYVVLTSDNPRTENPSVILSQMAEGINPQGNPCTVIEDRREAITFAVQKAAAEDIILIAGKGHELYQEIQGVKHPFSDVIEVRNAQRMKVAPKDALMRVKYLADLLPGAKFIGSDVAFSSVSTDTRTVTDGTLFFALKGERFDAHDFVMQAMQAGAVALVVDHEVYCPLPQIIVKDVKLALGMTASYWRGKQSLSMVAVAGSNGKTTTTQMIASILRAQYGEKSLSTQGNLNNDIGVPLMLWRLREQHEAAVIETGMNHVGEMRYLSEMVKPRVAIVTNAQREHQEFMQTVEATAHENGEIFLHLQPSGTAVIPCDDACKDIWLDMARDSQIMTFGLSHEADVSGTMTATRHGMDVQVKTPAGSFLAHLKCRGEHNFRNALGATAVALSLSLSLDTIVKGLEAFEPIKGRGAVIEMPHLTLIDDAYNANPDSMRASIDILASLSGPRLLVAADMLELGDKSKQYHEEIANYAVQKGIDGFIATGQAMKAAYEKFHALKPQAEAYWIADRAEFLEKLLEIKDRYRSISVKGSNSMRLDLAVKALIEASKCQKA